MSTAYLLDRSPNRISWSTGFALLIHGAILFGVGFSISLAPPPAPRLEITLAPHKSMQAPDEADFLAQHDQLGSGSVDDARELTTTDLAPLQDDAVRDSSASRPEAQAQTSVQAVVSRENPSADQSKSATEVFAESDQPDSEHQTTHEAKSEIQSLEAKLDRQRQSIARRPRIHRITSVSARRSEDAQYQIVWQQKIERVGNSHYPESARRKKLSGDVRLVVALLPDGQVKRIDVLASSGQPVLDQAAVRSVRLAAPFAPFPPELREKADILEIIRTWQFRNNTLSSRG